MRGCRFRHVAGGVILSKPKKIAAKATAHEPNLA
jgi:hypothetical protein